LFIHAKYLTLYEKKTIVLAKNIAIRSISQQYYTPNMRVGEYTRANCYTILQFKEVTDD